MRLVQALDYFVVPVNDLEAAEDFYQAVFGGRVFKRNGLNVRQRIHTAIEGWKRKSGTRTAPPAPTWTTRPVT